MHPRLCSPPPQPPGEHRRIVAEPMRTLLLSLTLCLATAPVYAQPSRVELDSALTRMLWAEAGIGPKGERDRTAMLFAIERLDEQEVRSSNMLETLKLHFGWWSKGYPPGRPWLEGIDTGCKKPDGFPGWLNWRVHQLGCTALVRLVRDHRAGKLKDPCRGRPNNWRARGRPSRKAKRMYYHVGCGRTLHNFFNTHRGPRGRVRKRMKHGKARVKTSTTHRKILGVRRHRWA